jgi:pimeloyl-ACP methyl ester carboxylesterase
MNNNHFFRYITTLVMLMLSACSVLQPTPTLTPTPADTPTPVASPTPFMVMGKIDVGGRSLDVFCIGKGSPTVVFENGYGANKEYWDSVFLEVVKFTRACMYDRANLGKSDPAPKPRTSQDMVDDLHTMLTKAQIPGPYLFVGHSMGAFNVLIYANQYPQDVAGIVLVDPSHPDQFDRWLAVLPTESASEVESLKNCHQGFTWMLGPNAPEGWDWLKSGAQVRSIGSLGDLPFTIITAGDQGEPCYPPTAEQEQQVWLDLHQEYLKLSTNSKQIIAEYAPHMVMENWPDVITQAIRERVDEVRK